MVPPPYVIESDVLKEAGEYFKSDDLEDVINGLKNTPLWADFAGPPPRIHIAMIWKSKGDLQTFQNLLKYEAGDWRDLLGETGLANENWKEVLVQRGLHPESWMRTK